ncbi:hypothetical protein ACH4NS_22485 [Streptomyces mutabilis]|jgi:hypothetical protein|uniref:hypothetical protein n=1 Tax=Streptomyces mutabilis TaxID=67332 RepID=UPI000A2405F1|nr:hypothetical protein [Streptomyces sp. Alain-F2R5]MDG9692910.1 hypothetical protein [Streptomyces sp. DH17]OSC73422.1 hypothetical protein B5181_00410 [Streptomyces sp. 4F]PAM98375.1 hypothetical protein CJI59_29080 [Streptomyces sp. Alain-F2R5]
MRKLSRFTRWATTAATLVGVAVVGPVVTAAPASAAGYGCAGDLSYSKAVYGNRNGYSGKLGTVYDYFDGTYNCSVFVKSAWAGTPSWLTLSIYREPNDGTYDEDSGNFSSYAGPVKIKAPRTCVVEMLDVYSPGGTQAFVGQIGPHSCG